MLPDSQAIFEQEEDQGVHQGVQQIPVAAQVVRVKRAATDVCFARKLLLEYFTSFFLHGPCTGLLSACGLVRTGLLAGGWRRRASNWRQRGPPNSGKRAWARSGQSTPR